MAYSADYLAYMASDAWRARRAAWYQGAGEAQPWRAHAVGASGCAAARQTGAEPGEGRSVEAGAATMNWRGLGDHLHWMRRGRRH